jgi:hypothetical protein
MDSFDQVEECIIETLENTAIFLRNNKMFRSTQWTKEIKKRLVELGTRFKYKSSTSTVEGCKDGEWLFDLIWYVNSEALSYTDRRLISLPLVVESEWNLEIEDIKTDFEKLLAARAEHRLMICETPINRKESILKCLEDSVQNFSLGYKGDRYLIAIWISDEKKFHFELIFKN